jgi:hypothetical protein
MSNPGTGISMPITNIVDRRKRRYRFETVNAIVEAAWHDNSVNDSDQVEQPADDDGPLYEEREHISLAEAVEWAMSFKQQVTLYVYDKDGGIYAAETTIKS